MMSHVSSQPLPHILMIGAGVIGSVYAAWLQQADQQVTILARGQRLVDLHEHGLCIEDTGTGQVLTTPIMTVDHLAPDDAYDLLIVAVRLEQVTAVLPLITANTPPRPFCSCSTTPLAPSNLVRRSDVTGSCSGFPVLGDDAMVPRSGTTSCHSNRRLWAKSAGSSPRDSECWQTWSRQPAIASP